MSLLQLKPINAFSGLPKSLSFDTRPDAVGRWNADVRAKDSGDNVITIYDQIGDGFFSEGVTAKRVAAALRQIGKREVVVNINSPGGDYFEGISIYNLLVQHPAKVTVQIVGMAASAASVIAMAGDDILMGEGSFLMIHNAWSLAVGNRHDLAASISLLEKVDEAMADLYDARCKLSRAEVVGMMDRETWIGRSKALEDGFATGEMDSAAIEQSGHDEQKKALALVEASLAQQGYSRAQRRGVFQNLFHGTPSAAAPVAMPCAGDTSGMVESMQTLIQTMRG